MIWNYEIKMTRAINNRPALYKKLKKLKKFLVSFKETNIQAVSIFRFVLPIDILSSSASFEYQERKRVIACLCHNKYYVSRQKKWSLTWITSRERRINNGRGRTECRLLSHRILLLCIACYSDEKSITNESKNTNESQSNSDGISL